MHELIPDTREIAQFYMFTICKASFLNFIKITDQFDINFTLTALFFTAVPPVHCRAHFDSVKGNRNAAEYLLSKQTRSIIERR